MPDLMLYNTLTRKKEPFAPLDAKNIRMYVCGPTVYDFAHIGNARPVIVFDVLFRLLRHLYGKEHVTYTRNITDVDDKINARAARDYPDLPINEAIRRVTESTNAQFQADVTALGCLEPTHQPRATGHIDDMIAIINRLLARGHAYIATGAEGQEVLFAVETMPRYGQLSNRKLADQVAGARVAVEGHKRNAGDFVLWKQSSQGEPGWAADFAGTPIYGRPGWHIECSAMSMAKLLAPFGGGLSCDDPAKNTFDIHGGGIDLVFPHHENEIAQSCCAFGTDKMANIWMHNGFLQIEGQKMSKSDGNFRTIREVLKDWPGEVARLTMLKTYYRQPIDWTDSSLQASADELQNWAILLEDLDEEFNEWPKRGYPLPPPDAEVVSALSNDLNFHNALTRTREMHKKASSYEDLLAFFVTVNFLGLLTPRRLQAHFAGGLIDIPRNKQSFAFEMQKYLRIATANRDIVSINEIKEKLAASGLAAVVDIDSCYVKIEALQSDSQEVQITSLITARNAARAAKNFAESDRIRAELEAMGLQLKDGKDENGNPTTTWEVKR